MGEVLGSVAVGQRDEHALCMGGQRLGGRHLVPDDVGGPTHLDNHVDHLPQVGTG